MKFDLLGTDIGSDDGMCPNFLTFPKYVFQIDLLKKKLVLFEEPLSDWDLFSKIDMNICAGENFENCWKLLKSVLKTVKKYWTVQNCVIYNCPT